MSDKENKNNDPNDDDSKEEKKVIEEVKKHVITIERDEKEKELQSTIDAEKKAKKDLNEELRNLREQIQTLQDEKNTKTTEYEELQGKFDTAQGKLLEIAQNTFERRKKEYMDVMRESELDDEKIKEIEEKIKTPEDLDNAEIYLTLIPNLLRQAKEEDEDKENKEKEDKELQDKKDKVSLEDQKEGGGVVSLEQKPGDFVYDSYREAIDDLYKRMAEGDEEAEKKLNELWKLGIKKLKEAPTAFSVQQCPRCGGGIYQGTVCPYCGWDKDKDWIVPAPER